MIVSPSHPLRMLAWLVCLLLIAATSATAAPTRFSPPLGERWFSIELNGERTGFARQEITASDDGYDVKSEASVKIKVLGVSRQASSWETYHLNRDLTLRSFSVQEIIDGSRMDLYGEAAPGELRVVTETANNKKEKKVKARGPVFPPPMLNLYPLMEKAQKGRKYKIKMFDPESVKVKDVTIKVVATEEAADGKKILHLQNDLYSFVDNDIWIDTAGNTLKESVRNGLVVTVAEDAASAARFIADAALAKKDMILDFSRIVINPPLRNPAGLSWLQVEFTGFPENFPLLQGVGQKADRLEGNRVIFTLSRPDVKAGEKPAQQEEQLRKYLESNPAIPADSTEIASTTRQVVDDEKDSLLVVRKLAAWVATSVEGAVTDAHSPLETLKTRKGNCQSHARLYTAMARNAGIPTKFVSGLVYIPDQGFVYHSWAESFLGLWVPVDPTFGQVPADVTHIKLVEGETPEDILPLVGVIGQVQAKVTAQK